MKAVRELVETLRTKGVRSFLVEGIRLPDVLPDRSDGQEQVTKRLRWRRERPPSEHDQDVHRQPVFRDTVTLEGALSEAGHLYHGPEPEVPKQRCGRVDDRLKELFRYILELNRLAVDVRLPPIERKDRTGPRGTPLRLASVPTPTRPTGTPGSVELDVTGQSRILGISPQSKR